MYVMGAVALTLTTIPYILPSIIPQLGIAVLIFPFLASLVSVFAAYLIVVQYMLYKLVDRQFRSLLGHYNPDDIPYTAANRPFRVAIGKIIAGSFLCFGVVGQLLSGLLLYLLMRGTLP
jgi:hypothetical protein